MVENTMTQIAPTTTKMMIGTRQRSRRRALAPRGFTLIEVLVVIGIIALLISILLPSLNAAQRAAMKVTCASNLRTIGQSYAQYTGESKGKYPPVNTFLGPNGPWGRPPLGPPPTFTPMGTIGQPDGVAIVLSQGYLPDPRVLYCPGGERTRSNSTATTGNKNAAGIDNLTFWAEGKRTGQWDPGPGPGGMHQTGYAIWEHLASLEFIAADWLAAVQQNLAAANAQRDG